MRRPSALSAVFVLVVALVAAWIISNTEWGEVAVPTPLRGDAATNPFYAAQKLVETLGATSERRESLGDTSTDAVLVLSTWSWDLDNARRAEFERWVEDGGRLVVDAALISGSDAFEEWSGIVRERDEPVNPAAQDVFQAPEIVEPCQARLAITYGSDDDDGEEDGYYDICDFDYASWLVPTRRVLWTLGEDDSMQGARVAVGKGSVAVVNGVPFVFRELFDGDHGEVLVAAANLHAGDQVVFMSEADVASLPELVWRHGAPVVVVLLLWIALALWRGALRFGPLVAPVETARRSLAEQILGTGRFAIRVGRGAALVGAAKRALHEAAARRIAGYERLSTAEQIAAVAGLAGVEAAELRIALDSNPIQRPIELRGRLALLESARRQLVSRSRWSKHGKCI
jgi:hypothetical protein